MPTCSLNHPSMGAVTGKQVDGCSQYLGVQYASLQHRFAPPELVQYDGLGLNATEYGPQVVSPPNGVDLEFSFIQQALPKPDFPGISDLHGLNLNITVPTAESSKSGAGLLPVLVFLHGGGFALGGNWWPQYDFAKLVRLSAELGKPVVGVNINYRVGAIGFMTCPELRENGCRPNNGLHDQRMALRWVNKYIAGFGGDPEQVTVMGESAGGVSTGLLLLSKEPLAKRLICLGGCPPLIGQIPIEAADSIAENVHSALGLQDVDSSDLFQALLDLPADDFYTKIPPTIPNLPVLDGDILLEPFSFKDYGADATRVPGKDFIEGILLCESKLDASIMAHTALFARQHGIGEAFRLSASKTLVDDPETLSSLLEHYSLTGQANKSSTDQEALFRVLQFINDVAFLMPAIELAAKVDIPDSYVLSFNEPNPWEGPFRGHATHILDVAFLFQNYNHLLRDTQRKTAVTFGEDVVTFASGEEPWKAFNRGQHGVCMYRGGGDKTFVEPPDGKVTGRDTFLIFLAIGEKGPGMEKLMEVFTNFMAGN